MENVYKVVSDELRSARVCVDGLSTQYKIGEWVDTPAGTGGLFVFTDLSEAMKFVSFYERIFVVEVEGLFPVKFASYYHFDIFGFWKNYDAIQRDGYFTSLDLHEFCDGGVGVAKRVKLVREVSENS